ncbi:MAG TPA: M48 family metallopeptidase, partial [Bradyrhizobium sp.]|nr:M48 family metallopeptidase [Bradyrhizobium sp.]
YRHPPVTESVALPPNAGEASCLKPIVIPTHPCFPSIGSCGKNRTIYFNWRLLQLPIQLIDYVILHEQVHLLHNDHSHQFWRSMDSGIPPR